ncbi:MAG TPA: SOS response-associated peptidase [Anaerolineales bacterium]|nr:SOS response-associated peptidase [Anaerolineales bacterium]
MCGRFTLSVDPADLKEAFAEFILPAQVAERYNIAPTQPVVVIPNDGKNTADFFVWGLVPSWAKDPAIGSRLINARAETLAEKPAFRSAYKYHRCLILADGFFEWKAMPGSSPKVPHYIRLKTGQPFAFAGLWDHWLGPDGSEIKSATIITTSPNELMAPIHNRMPVILPKEAYSLWLDPTPHFPVDLNSLLKPYPADDMIAYPISTLVNSPANDTPDVLVPA